MLLVYLHFFTGEAMNVFTWFHRNKTKGVAVFNRHFFLNPSVENNGTGYSHL